MAIPEISTRDLLELREGVIDNVYQDTRGIATGGMGHKLSREELQLYPIGSVLSKEVVDAWADSDISSAEIAARGLMDQAGITNPYFIPFIASVCFQLGNYWTLMFPHTWRLICDGKYDEAAEALDNTTWKHQTPMRVEDFQIVLKGLSTQ